MGKFYDPNAKPKVIQRWKNDVQIRAMGAVIASGGTIQGARLAGILGVSPRALRELLVRDGTFLVDYRYRAKECKGSKDRVDEAWYRINPERLPPPPADLPPLRPKLLRAPTTAERSSGAPESARLPVLRRGG